MLVVKTISQFSHTYQVPDALGGDFLRWLAGNQDVCGDYEADQQFIHEFIVDARRESDPGPGEGTGQSNSETHSGTGDGVAGD